MFKVGDKVRILKKPFLWSSMSGGKYPLENDFKYPFEGIIEDIDSVSAKISGYGFCLEKQAKLEIELINSDISLDKLIGEISGLLNYIKSLKQ